MGLDGDLFANVSAGGCPQDEVERVFGIDRKTTDLGAVHLKRSRDVASLLAVAVQAQGDQVGSSQLDRVPFQDDGSLGRISATECGLRRFLGAKRLVNALLQGTEFLLGRGLFGGVLGDVDVDDAAGGDVGGKEDGRKLDLAQGLAQVKTIDIPHCHRTKRLSGVSRTVTPASTLPTVRETSMVVVRVSWLVRRSGRCWLPMAKSRTRDVYLIGIEARKRRRSRKWQAEWEMKSGVFVTRLRWRW